MNINLADKRPFIICIMGPTAVGKTKIAVALKKKYNIDIISVDSLLIYRGMDIGTSKPSKMELVMAPHKLINIKNPWEYYSVAHFCHDAFYEISSIIKHGLTPLLVGGTMLYFKRLLEGLSILPPADDNIRLNLIAKAKVFGWMMLYKKLQKIDPHAAKKIHPNDKIRLLRAIEVFLISGKTLTELVNVYRDPFPYRVYQFAIMPCNFESLCENIVLRFHHMLDIGFEDEVQKLFNQSNIHKNTHAMRSVGYRQMWSYISGDINYNDMIFHAINATKHLAKHQITWLRKWNNIYILFNNNIISVINKILQIINR